eukprot:COSAG01_NODE_39147_length_480_cov_1.286089_1_plen_98_part_10
MESMVIGGAKDPPSAAHPAPEPKDGGDAAVVGRGGGAGNSNVTSFLQHVEIEPLKRAMAQLEARQAIVEAKGMEQARLEAELQEQLKHERTEHAASIA